MIKRIASQHLGRKDMSGIGLHVTIAPLIEFPMVDTLTLFENIPDEIVVSRACASL